ncbi:hypothetical protein GCM10010313_81850 [Streptomyces violarus]|uniref:Uncharacterized protein n=1 Tax=Streptomyces violarus TaxID=67380 RepID=A0A7W5A015_9ACTN|nr:hypothetical protein [Streptomyces violarus]MBB3081672.1 hypothetical protein [Streptomyces violarus]GHD34878.1 hypothetical protein GCM10010313_81850 [Streptomyces violarus]
MADRWPDETVGVAQACFLDDAIAARLGVKGNPWSNRVWADVIEAAPRGPNPGSRAVIGAGPLLGDVLRLSDDPFLKELGAEVLDEQPIVSIGDISGAVYDLVCASLGDRPAVVTVPPDHCGG